MDTNTYPDMDFGAFKMAILEKANLLLKDVSEENLKYFAEETKKIAESAMEQYAFKVYDLYTEGACKIDNLTVLESFTDYQTGYQGQMLHWNESHPILLKEQKVSIPSQPELSTSIVKPGVVMGVGTAVAVGLFIFTNIWVALAAELLTVALSYMQVARKKAADNRYEVQKADYEREMKQLRSKLINGLISELEEWLKQGKAMSDSILKSYNL